MLFKKLIISLFIIGCSSNFNNDFLLQNPRNDLTLDEFKSLDLKSGDTQNYNIDIITYFKNLHKYSPENNWGSCGYVSLIQYLSYYDSFINDNLIPKKYEKNDGVCDSLYNATKNSPGVLNLKSNIDNKNYEQIEKFVNDNKNIDFQSYLMYKNNEINDFGNFNYSIGMWNYEKLLKKSLSNFNFEFKYIRAAYNRNEYGNHVNDKTIIMFDNFVKKELDKGNPVILHCAGKLLDEENKYSKYHSVVAYYYDEKGIHCNFGWGSFSTDRIIDNKNYFITEAGFFDFSSLNHVHSFHYNINDLGYCGCGYTKHIHNYNKYLYIDDKKHKNNCSCLDTINSAHFVNSDSFTNGESYANCLLCGGKASIGFTLVLDLDNTYDDLNIIYLTENNSFIFDNIIFISDLDLILIKNDILSWEDFLYYEI